MEGTKRKRIDDLHVERKRKENSRENVASIITHVQLVNLGDKKAVKELGKPSNSPNPSPRGMTLNLETK